MFYEEKEIDGILMCRTTPDGKWEPKPFPVWITKYALTSGITTCMAVKCSEGTSMIQVQGQRWSPFYHGKDWHTSEEAALEDFERRKTAKIASLKKSLAKMEKLQPKICPLFPKEGE